MKFSHHALLMAILLLSMHKRVTAASSPANTGAVSTDRDDQASVPEADEQKRSLQLYESWRVMANEANLVSWRISFLEFYPTTDCSGNPHDTEKFTLSSTSSSDVDNAFVSDDKFWEDSNTGQDAKDFFIEFTAPSGLSIQCFKLVQPTGYIAKSVILKYNYDASWVLAFTGDNLQPGTNIIGWSLPATSADDTIICPTNGYRSLVCDNDPTTCFGDTSFDSFAVSSEELGTIILYPNKSYDWSSVDKGSVKITYHNSEGKKLETDYIFGTPNSNREVPTDPIVLNKFFSSSSGLNKIILPTHLLCEVETYKEAGVEPSFGGSTPKPTPNTPAPSAALKDKYDIKVNSKATFIFDKNSIGNEMTTWYYVTGEYLKKIILTFFKVGVDGKSCGEGITAGQMKMVSGPEEVGKSGSGGALIAEIKVDMDLPNIVQKEEIYNKLSDTTGEFLVCVRADVVEDGGETGATGANVITLGETTGVSVSFTETIYKVTLDVAQGFESADVTAVKVVDPTVDATAETKYGVSACQCDSSVSTKCAAKSMNQNSVLDICVELDDAADGVVIGDIKTLNLEQGSISVKAISGSTANSLTEVSGKDSKDVVIKTRLISGFFTDSSAGKPISVSGIVLVKFMNTGRQLASLADLSRDLQVNDGDVASEEDFSFDIELEAEASAPASGINMSFVGNTVIVAAIVGIGGMM